MDYYLIGQRIRKYRKACMMSQEELAEIIDISTTHMSHIETGNTKLSLPVIADIAGALNAGVDDLLNDTPTKGEDCCVNEIAALLNGATTKERRIVMDIVKAATESMRKNR